MKQPLIDQNACIGCGTCAALASATFAIDPATGTAKVIKPAGNTQTEITAAVDACPCLAITYSEF